MKFLVTGCAGFIGFHLVKKLLNENHEVVGIDNLNNYYSLDLKKSRLKKIQQEKNNKKFHFKKFDLKNLKLLDDVFKKNNFDIVIHLAAQAGVRYSIENPNAYIDSNIISFTNLFECCKYRNVSHIMFASSSSVYGIRNKQPLNVEDNTDHPISLYAATKKSNEVLAFSYSHLYDLAVTGLRFFTVYGPYGRPDMAYYSFTKSILNGEEIKLFNKGKMKRDFTYIDDVTEAIYSAVFNKPKKNILRSTSSKAKYNLLNIGNNKPVGLLRFVEVIEKHTGKKAKVKFLPMQPGDVISTFADIDKSIKEIYFKPKIDIEEGIKKFVCWYKEYHKK